MNTHALSTDGTEARRGVSTWYRRTLLRTLDGLSGGRLRIVDSDGIFEAGQAQKSADDLYVTVEVLDPAFYRLLTRGGSVGAGEAYRDGLWRSDDLVGLIRLFARNRDRLDALDDGSARVLRWFDTIRHTLRQNSRRGSRRNIHAHYDLSNALFETFLDERMMYSSAMYLNDRDTLDVASVNKLDRIVDKLALQANDHLLEIGSGWGGLAIHAARRSGCRVTTITLSEEQRVVALERVHAAGLDERVTVLNRDYRDMSGTYSKLVSVEMVEAVGDQYLDRFFHSCDHLLEPGGLFLLQAITIEDHRYRRALESVDFIKKHIFPGSFIPSVGRLVAGSVHRTRFTLLNMEDLGLDYARTLNEWRTRFIGNLDELAALGFDERFQRLWEFYLCYCEGGFLERSISDVQMLFAKTPYRGRVWRQARH